MVLLAIMQQGMVMVVVVGIHVRVVTVVEEMGRLGMLKLDMQINK
jgi:hypothetical protein